MENSLLGGEACGDSFSRCARSLTVLELDTEYYTTPVFLIIDVICAGKSLQSRAFVHCF